MKEQDKAAAEKAAKEHIEAMNFIETVTKWHVDKAFKEAFLAGIEHERENSWRDVEKELPEYNADINFKIKGYGLASGYLGDNEKWHIFFSSLAFCTEDIESWQPITPPKVKDK